MTVMPSNQLLEEYSELLYQKAQSNATSNPTIHKELTDVQESRLHHTKSQLESKLARIEYQEKYQSDQVMTPLNGLLELQRISIQHTNLQRQHDALVKAIQDIIDDAITTDSLRQKLQNLLEPTKESRQSGS